MPDEQWDFWETLATTGRRGVILLAHFVLAVLFIVLLAGVERVFTFFGDPLVVPPSWSRPIGFFACLTFSTLWIWVCLSFSCGRALQKCSGIFKCSRRSSHACANWLSSGAY